MSHGVHAVQHEVEHQIKHEEHGHDSGGGRKGLVDNTNRKIALVISVMALLLAISEMLGKSAQTEGISANVEAANLWAFFQAKTIRRTLVETVAKEVTINALGTTDPVVKAAMDKQIADWKSEGARYRSEPSTREGSSELAARAKEAEKRRYLAMARYHHYEFASAAYQIGIVLASAAVITGIFVLVWVAMGLGGIGIAFMALGYFNPDYLHHLHLI